MSKSMKEKLEIVNVEGEVDESNEYGSWVGTKIRKGRKIGKIIRDMNGIFRRLTVRFQNNIVEEITLNNIGQDPESSHQYEWYEKTRKVWYRF